MDIRTLLHSLTHGYSYTDVVSKQQMLHAPNKFMLAAAKLITILYEDNIKLQQTVQQLQVRELAAMDDIENLRNKLKELNDQIPVDATEEVPQELDSGKASQSPNLPP